MTLTTSDLMLEIESRIGDAADRAMSLLDEELIDAAAGIAGAEYTYEVIEAYA